MACFSARSEKAQPRSRSTNRRPRVRRRLPDRAKFAVDWRDWRTTTLKYSREAQLPPYHLDMRYLTNAAAARTNTMTRRTQTRPMPAHHHPARLIHHNVASCLTRRGSRGPLPRGRRCLGSARHPPAFDDRIDHRDHQQGQNGRRHHADHRHGGALSLSRCHGMTVFTLITLNG
jgi:hypothetical protein